MNNGLNHLYGRAMITVMKTQSASHNAVQSAWCPTCQLSPRLILPQPLTDRVFARRQQTASALSRRKMVDEERVCGGNGVHLRALSYHLSICLMLAKGSDVVWVDSRCINLLNLRYEVYPVLRRRRLELSSASACSTEARRDSLLWQGLPCYQVIPGHWELLEVRVHAVSRLAPGIYSAKLYNGAHRGRKTAEEECIHGQLSACAFITCSDVWNRGMKCEVYTLGALYGVLNGNTVHHVDFLKTKVSFSTRGSVSSVCYFVSSNKQAVHASAGWSTQSQLTHCYMVSMLAVLNDRKIALFSINYNIFWNYLTVQHISTQMFQTFYKLYP